MTGSVTKVTSIQFINSNSHIKKRRGRKTVLSGYYVCLSHDLLLMASGADTNTHTHTHTRTYTNIHGRNDFKKPGACRPAHAWFKKKVLIAIKTKETSYVAKKSLATHSTGSICYYLCLFMQT